MLSSVALSPHTITALYQKHRQSTIRTQFEALTTPSFPAAIFALSLQYRQFFCLRFGVLLQSACVGGSSSDSSVSLETDVTRHCNIFLKILRRTDPHMGTTLRSVTRETLCIFARVCSPLLQAVRPKLATMAQQHGQIQLAGDNLVQASIQNLTTGMVSCQSSDVNPQLRRLRETRCEHVNIRSMKSWKRFAEHRGPTS